MASGDSPRARIDQFFASKKKRKAISPSVKSKKVGKDAKIAVEGSPGTKGSLDNFLVGSEENKNSPNRAASESPVKRVPIKRNLTLEISLSSKDEKKDALLPMEVRAQGLDLFGYAQRVNSETSNDFGGSVAGASKEVPENATAGEAENPELKRFATNFLSLYCSASVPSETNVHAIKRHGSPSALDSEDRSSKRRHCNINMSQLHVEGEGICSGDVHSKPLQSAIIDESGNAVSKCSTEIELGDNETVPGTSLKRCVNASLTIDAAGCITPGSLNGKLGRHETPKSGRGSSIFSPGETFWKEAIQVADGLLIPKDNLHSQFALESEHLKPDKETSMANNLPDGGCGNKLNNLLYAGVARDSNGGINSVVGPVSRHSKDLVKEVSPLPVKHFDFSKIEDKNMDEETPSYVNLSSQHIIKGKTPGCVSQNQEYKQICHNLSLQNNAAHTECDLLGVQDMISKYDATENKLNIWAQDHSDMFTTKDRRLNDLTPKGGFNQDDSPSSFLPLEDRLDLNNWLPSELCSIYKKRGMSKLYPWQVDCLQVDGVLQNRNLVYSASTSAGKSFVAEILMLRRILSTGKMAFLVLPYVSICAEKAEHLEVLLEPLGKQVRSYYGNQGGGTLPKDTSVAVCTIEKANSLINRLLEEGRLSELGIIVIDELHMVGDQHRGYLLELLLTKLRYAAGEGSAESSSGESSGTGSSKADPVRGLQIVGMSATLPNVAAVADWLQAALYETDFRPVPLEEYIKVGYTIYNKEMNIVRTIPKIADIGGKDPDHIVELCNEIVQEGHSVLIFCSSRKGCESTARHVAKYLKKFSVSPQNGQNELMDLEFAIDALHRSPAGLDPVLEETLPAGVAYHHAGLTVEERETVETCYRKGFVRVLTATSTLAAGVNLPARRVIFRQPRIGRDFIDGTRYRQMAGRAGRTGIDTKGESVLICKPEETKRILGILNEGCPALYSCLSEDKNGMTHAILEVVAGGIVQTANDIHRYVRCTLLNSTKPFGDVVRSAQDSLRWLCHKKFLEWSEDTKLYTTTPLGRASFGSSLSPEESMIVLDDLTRARDGFVLASDLHLVYLVTPTNVDVEPDWELYYERFMELSALDKSVGNRVGVQEPFLMRMAHGAPLRTSNRLKNTSKGLQAKPNCIAMWNSAMLSDEQMLRVSRRFYVALILSTLVQEVPVAEVCAVFKVARGMVQALQDNAGRFASMVSVFCERLGWHDLADLVAKFQNRVSFGVKAEIVELTTIPYVKGSRARALYKAGLRTPQTIAEASIPEIAKALFESSSWAAQGTAQWRIQLGVAKKIKNGARRIVLEKAEEARIAAFSAFKSLGLEVPPLSRPLLSIAAGNAPQKEASSSSVEESTSSLGGLKHNEQTDNITGFVSKAHEQKLARTSFTGVNSAGAKQGEVVADKTASVMEGPNAPYMHNSTSDYVDNANTSLSCQLSSIRHGRSGYVDKIDNFGEQQQNRGTPHTASKERVLDKGPINASNIPGGFDTFLNWWDNSQEFYLDVHFNRRSEVNSTVLFEIHGMAICWENSPVYYVSIPKDLLLFNSRKTDKMLSNISGDNGNAVPPMDQFDLAKSRWQRIGKIIGKKDVRKFTWNSKVQIQVLRYPAVSIHRLGNLNSAVKSVGLELIDDSYFVLSPLHVQNFIDLSIAAWILWPDEEKSSNPNLEKEIKKRLSCEAAAAASRNGRWKNQMRRAAHNGCCRRVAQIRALSSVLWKLLISEELVEAFLSIEIPLVNVLADMELWGIGVDMEGCLRARNILGKKLKYLEKEAHQLAGMSFSLYMAADIANVLYEHLKIPIPEGHNKGKYHPSTDKRCLDLLRNEHPIISVIKEHRTFAKLLNCTLGSICSLSKLSARTQRYTLHGHWLQTSTATGRLSMEEPNLQCVEHGVDFKMNRIDLDGKELVDEYHKVNAREFFVATQDDWYLLTADYSQIELRLMAHFSKDPSLVELLNKRDSDVFSMIAAKWTGKVESSVSSQERDQTKRLVYGMLYGMGANSLAEQLNCTSDEAAERICCFKTSFPGVATWLQEVVTSCRQKGYVKTLKGRKRFLAKIKFGNSKEKSKAHRQAVNSICQGSAADIIKIAMINLHSVVAEDADTSCSSCALAEKFHMLKGRCRILLQVHDELVMEADPLVVKEAGLLLQLSMESAASLLVPLLVKVKVGKTWGSMEPFHPE
ncbi:helicase and polymerase-containing protein TEBICHI isoform X1 [Coffea arabica]|uniref:Helicase and polymerase-containing protein TEBICHI isoform X1 n=1 Tax=Coffea arabica TaxID=13443 RepID=A0A6P6U2R9_COFAR|nr:helicase and polymerase-containing protein TEBICHI-like isoform X1 [Coffea arabica]XP_027084959.1 helicase and polymerase-containing protein TEBICHI-like isoform X1 [Coffea arabica]XP_027084960.1 helicase and polymerase-containing protein TEBICHI-like isoform X1 [Coffea arabica]